MYQKIQKMIKVLQLSGRSNDIIRNRVYYLNELYPNNKVKFAKNIHESSSINIFNSFKDNLYK